MITRLSSLLSVLALMANINPVNFYRFNYDFDFLCVFALGFIQGTYD